MLTYFHHRTGGGLSYSRCVEPERAKSLLLRQLRSQVKGSGDQREVTEEVKTRKGTENQ
jgi:hypothetical protein